MPELVGDGGEGQAPDVVAVEAHRPQGHVVETGDQVGDGGLAGAGGTHDGGQLARHHPHVEVLESPGPGRLLVGVRGTPLGGRWAGS